MSDKAASSVSSGPTPSPDLVVLDHQHDEVGGCCSPDTGELSTHNFAPAPGTSPSGLPFAKWLFWLAPVLATLFFVASEPGDDGVVICPTRRLCGVWCPGCGMTRAVGHLVRGDWSQAITYHPLVPLAVAQAVVGWVMFAGVRLDLWTTPKARRIAFVLVVDFVLLIAVWVFRLNAGSFDTLR